MPPPPTPVLIDFKITIVPSEPDLFVTGNIFAAGDRRAPIPDGRDVVVKKTNPGCCKGEPDDYVLQFNISKKGKFKLSVVTVANPKGTSKDFDTEKVGLLDVIFDFQVLQ